MRNAIKTPSWSYLTSSTRLGDRVEYYNFKKWIESACVCRECTNCLGTIEALYVSRLWPPSQDHVAQRLSFSSNGLGILPFFQQASHRSLPLHFSQECSLTVWNQHRKGHLWAYHSLTSFSITMLIFGWPGEVNLQPVMYIFIFFLNLEVFGNMVFKQQSFNFNSQNIY